MFHLTRRAFPDLLLVQDDLDDIAELWLVWHEQSRAKGLRRLRGYHSICLRLWGFPRQHGPALALALEAKLAAADLELPVSLADPDYLTATTPLEEATEPALLGRWLSFVEDTPFDNLVLLLELSIYDWPDESEKPAAAGGTLVLCGQLQKNGFRLKAIWPVGLEPGLENLYKLAAWSNEENLLQALETFRRGVVPVPVEDFFQSRPVQRGGNWLNRLIIHVPGPQSFREGRLASFLFRSSFHLFFLMLTTLVYFEGPDWPYKRGTLFSLFLLFLGLFAYVVETEVVRVSAFYSRMTAGLKRVYSQPLRFQEVDFADYGLENDPNANKYTRELEGLGCRHLGDFRLQRGPAGKTVVRVFVLPDERIYVFLNLMIATEDFLKFPAHAYFLITTYLIDGRIVTINEGGGYRKSLNPEIFTRRFPDIHDPAELLAKHRKFVAEIFGPGHELAPLLDLQELFERMQEDHEQTRLLMKKWGYYSWSAAFRQSFELVRKEYMEPKSESSDSG